MSFLNNNGCNTDAWERKKMGPYRESYLVGLSALFVYSVCPITLFHVVCVHSESAALEREEVRIAQCWMVLTCPQT